MQPLIATYLIWDAWALSWLVAALWSSRAQARPAAFTRTLLYRALTLIGALMLFASGFSRRLWTTPYWHAGHALGWALAATTLLGVLFTWWARLHLGALWSGSVTRKADHHVVDTGPYRLVRHPIYTGIILASFALAIEIGTGTALAGAALMTVGWYVKARIEERFLRAELGADAYDAYARKTAMLVPFVRI